MLSDDDGHGTLISNPKSLTEIFDENQISRMGKNTTIYDITKIVCFFFLLSIWLVFSLSGWSSFQEIYILDAKFLFVQ